MVTAVRGGRSLRSVARTYGMSLLTVQRWLQRAGDAPLDQVDWNDHCHAPGIVANRTPTQIENLVLTLRQQLSQESALGEYGAQAIRRELLVRPDIEITQIPSVPTINRVLARHGIFDCHRRVRRPAPPIGWYLPLVGSGQAELDQFDAVVGLVLEGGLDVELLNVVSLHGGLVGSWPTCSVTAVFTQGALLEHWRSFGRPTFAQFDNDMRFQGPHRHPDVVGSVSRLCLSLSVTPVFVPPRETGFQAAIESYNNRWQQKVWQRFHHEDLAALQKQSARYLLAARQKGSVRQEGAPQRAKMPDEGTGNPVLSKTRLQGQIIYIRRTNDHGHVNLLGRDFEVDEQWLNRLVRSEVDLDQGIIRFFALRRSQPDQQLLLKVVPYHLPEGQY